MISLNDILEISACGFFCKNLLFPYVLRERNNLDTSFFVIINFVIIIIMANPWARVFLSSFSSITRSVANLSVRFLTVVAASFSSSHCVSCRGGSSSKIAFESCSITSGFTFYFTVSAIRSCSNQILNCHGGSNFAVAQNTGIPI